MEKVIQKSMELQFLIDRQVKDEQENEPNAFLERNRKIRLGSNAPEISPVKIKIRKGK